MTQYILNSGVRITDTLVRDFASLTPVNCNTNSSRNPIYYDDAITPSNGGIASYQISVDDTALTSAATNGVNYTSSEDEQLNIYAPYDATAGDTITLHFSNLSTTRENTIHCYRQENNNNIGIKLGSGSTTIETGYEHNGNMDIATNDYFVLIHSDDAKKHHLAKITKLLSFDNSGDAFEFEPAMENEIEVNTKFRIFKGPLTTDTKTVAVAYGLIQDSSENRHLKYTEFSRPTTYFYNSRLDEKNVLNAGTKYQLNQSKEIGGTPTHSSLLFRTRRDFENEIIDTGPYNTPAELVDVLYQSDRYNSNAIDGGVRGGVTSYSGSWTAWDSFMINGERSTNGQFTAGTAVLTGPIRYLHYEISPTKTNIVNTVLDINVSKGYGSVGNLCKVQALDHKKILASKIQEQDTFKVYQDLFELEITKEKDTAIFGSFAGSSGGSTLTVTKLKDGQDLRALLRNGSAFESFKLGDYFYIPSAITAPSGGSQTITVGSYRAINALGAYASGNLQANYTAATAYRRRWSSVCQNLIVDFEIDTDLTYTDLNTNHAVTTYKVNDTAISKTRARIYNLEMVLRDAEYSGDRLLIDYGDRANGVVYFQNENKVLYSQFTGAGNYLDFFSGQCKIQRAVHEGEVEEIHTETQDRQPILTFLGMDKMAKLLGPVVNKNYLHSEDYIYSTQGPVMETIVGPTTSSVTNVGDKTIAVSSWTNLLADGDYLFTADNKFIGEVESANNTLITLRTGALQYVGNTSAIWYADKSNANNVFFGKALSSDIGATNTFSNLRGTSGKGVVFVSGKQLDGTAMGDDLVGTSYNNNGSNLKSIDTESRGFYINDASSIQKNETKYYAKLGDESSSSFSGDSVHAPNSLSEYQILSFTPTSSQSTIIKMAPTFPIVLGRIDTNANNTTYSTLTDGITIEGVHSKGNIIAGFPTSTNLKQLLGPMYDANGNYVATGLRVYETHILDDVSYANTGTVKYNVEVDRNIEHFGFDASSTIKLLSENNTSHIYLLNHQGLPVGGFLLPLDSVKGSKSDHSKKIPVGLTHTSYSNIYLRYINLNKFTPGTLNRNEIKKINKMDASHNLNYSTISSQLQGVAQIIKFNPGLSSSSTGITIEESLEKEYRSSYSSVNNTLIIKNQFSNPYERGTFGVLGSSFGDYHRFYEGDTVLMPPIYMIPKSGGGQVYGIGSAHYDDSSNNWPQYGYNSILEIRDVFTISDPKAPTYFLFGISDILPESMNRPNHIGYHSNSDFTDFSLILKSNKPEQVSELSHDKYLGINFRDEYKDELQQRVDISAASINPNQIKRFGLMRLVEATYDFNFNPIDGENPPNIKDSLCNTRIKNYYLNQPIERPGNIKNIVIFTGTLTSGNTGVSGVSVAADTLLASGMNITGTGIQSSTTISSVTDANNIVLSKTASATGTLVELRAESASSPFNNFATTGYTATFTDATCDLVNHDATVTCNASSQIFVGMGVTCATTGFPSGATVASINTGTQGVNVTSFELSAIFDPADGVDRANQTLTFGAGPTLMGVLTIDTDPGDITNQYLYTKFGELIGKAGAYTGGNKLPLYEGGATNTFHATSYIGDVYIPALEASNPTLNRNLMYSTNVNKYKNEQDVTINSLNVDPSVSSLTDASSMALSLYGDNGNPSYISTFGWLKGHNTDKSLDATTNKISPFVHQYIELLSTHASITNLQSALLTPYNNYYFHGKEGFRNYNHIGANAASRPYSFYDLTRLLQEPSLIRKGMFFSHDDFIHTDFSTLRANTSNLYPQIPTFPYSSTIQLILEDLPDNFSLYNNRITYMTERQNNFFSVMAGATVPIDGMVTLTNAGIATGIEGDAYYRNSSEGISGTLTNHTLVRIISGDFIYLHEDRGSSASVDDYIPLIEGTKINFIGSPTTSGPGSDGAQVDQEVLGIRTWNGSSLGVRTLLDQTTFTSTTTATSYQKHPHYGYGAEVTLTKASGGDTALNGVTITDGGNGFAVNDVVVVGYTGVKANQATGGFPPLAIPITNAVYRVTSVSGDSVTGLAACNDDLYGSSGAVASATNWATDNGDCFGGLGTSIGGLYTLYPVLVLTTNTDSDLPSTNLDVLNGTGSGGIIPSSFYYRLPTSGNRYTTSGHSAVMPNMSRISLLDMGGFATDWLEKGDNSATGVKSPLGKFNEQFTTTNATELKLTHKAYSAIYKLKFSQLGDNDYEGDAATTWQSTPKRNSSGTAGEQLLVIEITTEDIATHTFGQNGFLNFVDLTGMYLVSESGKFDGSTTANTYFKNSTTSSDMQSATGKTWLASDGIAYSRDIEGITPDYIYYVVSHEVVVGSQQTTTGSTAYNDKAIVHRLWLDNATASTNSDDIPPNVPFRVMKPAEICTYDSTPNTIPMYVLSKTTSKQPYSDSMYSVVSNSFNSNNSSHSIDTIFNEGLLSMYVALDVDTDNSDYVVCRDKGDLFGASPKPFVHNSSYNVLKTDGNIKTEDTLIIEAANNKTALTFNSMEKTIGVLSIGEIFELTTKDRIFITDVATGSISSSLIIAPEAEDIVNNILKRESIDYSKRSDITSFSDTEKGYFLAPEFLGGEANLFSACNSTLGNKSLELYVDNNTIEVSSPIDFERNTSIEIDEMNKDTQNIMLASKNKNTFELYNDVVVYGKDLKVRKRDLESIKLKGKRTLERIDRTISDKVQAEQLAQKLLRLHSSENIELKIETDRRGTELVKIADSVVVHYPSENIPRSNYMITGIDYSIDGVVKLTLSKYSKGLGQLLAENITEIKRLDRTFKEDIAETLNQDIDLFDELEIGEVTLQVHKITTSADMNYTGVAATVSSGDKISTTIDISSTFLAGANLYTNAGTNLGVIESVSSTQITLVTPLSVTLTKGDLLYSPSTASTNLGFSSGALLGFSTTLGFTLSGGTATLSNKTLMLDLDLTKGKAFE